MNKLAISGLALLATQCFASLMPPREIERTSVAAADLEVISSGTRGFKAGDIGGEAHLQDDSDAELKSFWEALEEDTTEFQDASDDDLEEFPWSLTSNDSDDDDDVELDDVTAIGDLLEDVFFDDLSVEDRINFGAVGGWIKNKAQQLGATAKAVFVKTGGKKLLEQGLNLIKALKVRVDPLSCANKTCGSCIYVDVAPLNGHKACVKFGILTANKIGALIRLGQRILFEQSFGFSSNAICVSLPFPLGPVCLQSVQVAKNGTDMGFCMVLAIKQFKVGGQFCANLVDGRLKPSFKAMRIPVEEQFKTMFVLDEKEKVEKVTAVVDIATHPSTSQSVATSSEKASETTSQK